MFKTYLRHLETIRIGEILVKKGLINDAVLEAAIQTQQQTHQKLGEVLVQQGHISSRQLNRILRQQRLMKTVATLLLASGASAITLPQVFSPSASLRPVSVSQQEKDENVGGGSLNYDGSPVNSKQKGTPAKVATRLPSFMKVALKDNPKPTVYSPLIGFCHPTNGRGYLSQGNNGITHRGRMAYAYDLATPIGTPIYAMRSGKVVGMRDRYPDTGGGRSRYSKFNYVWIEHDGGFRSAYLHLQQDFLDAVPLQMGMTVEAGQLIGYSGNSGWSSGPHLHVEVQRPGRSSSFSKSVPFEVSGRCQAPAIASEPSASSQ